MVYFGKDKTMEITREKAVAIMVGLGFKTAPKMSTEKLEKRINGLNEVVDDSVTTGKKKLDITLKKILAKAGKVTILKAAKEAEEEAEVEETEEVEETTPKVKSKKEKVVKEKKEKAPKKDVVAKDKFGSRADSITARFNAALSKKAKTMKELMEEAKITRNYKDHADKLIEKGLVEKTDKGYKLV